MNPNKTQVCNDLAEVRDNLRIDAQSLRDIALDLEVRASDLEQRADRIEQSRQQLGCDNTGS